MISAVTLNPCIDRTVFLPSLIVGGHNVASRVQNDVSGKGINVNVVLSNLGVETKAVGFEFRRSGTPVKAFLDSLSIPSDMVSVDAELRVNTKLFDSGAMEMTEINCKGPHIGKDAVEELMRVFERNLDGTDIIVIDGSVPPGVPIDIYKTMTELAHAKGIKVVLDATGDLLAKGLEARPDIVKPNVGELELLIGRKLSGIGEWVAACNDLTAQGVGAVCLSLGGDGALYVTGDKAWYSKGLDIEVRSFQGAGDSLVAGICLGIMAGYEPETLLRSAMAAAHGSLLRDGTLLCLREDYDKFFEIMPVEMI